MQVHQVVFLFLCIRYKCGKLNSGLTMRANTTRALEQNALPYVLSWLGLQVCTSASMGDLKQQGTTTDVSHVLVDADGTTSAVHVESQGSFVQQAQLDNVLLVMSHALSCCTACCPALVV